MEQSVLIFYKSELPDPRSHSNLWPNLYLMNILFVYWLFLFFEHTHSICHHSICFPFTIHSVICQEVTIIQVDIEKFVSNYFQTSKKNIGLLTTIVKKSFRQYRQLFVNVRNYFILIPLQIKHKLSNRIRDKDLSNHSAGQPFSLVTHSSKFVFLLFTVSW